MKRASKVSWKVVEARKWFLKNFRSYKRFKFERVKARVRISGLIIFEQIWAKISKKDKYNIIWANNDGKWARIVKK